MGAVVRIHRPALATEEKDHRMEQIRGASMRFYKEVNKRKAANESEGEYVKGFHDR